MTFKFKALVLATGLLLGLAVPAHAANFTLSSIDISLNSSDPGLVVGYANKQTPLAFSLNEGQTSPWLDLFDIGTAESTVNIVGDCRVSILGFCISYEPGDDIQPKPISVAFNFTDPATFGGTAHGQTNGNSLLGLIDLGSVVWNTPLDLAFGTTGLLRIWLSDVEFGVPGSATVQSKFQLVHADAPVVPEPATLLLFGTGLSVAAARLRGRRRSRQA